MREFMLLPAGIHDDLNPAEGGQDARPGRTGDSYGAIGSLQDFTPMLFRNKTAKESSASHLQKIMYYRKI